MFIKNELHILGELTWDYILRYSTLKESLSQEIFSFRNKVFCLLYFIYKSKDLYTLKLFGLK